ncbi:hypothetical protein [Planktothrix agardhii]|uniref:hypothetical protein n=1 Tax=Planktothrix agardhii TaxID=1160 RepID=UPI0039AE9BEE
MNSKLLSDPLPYPNNTPNTIRIRGAKQHNLKNVDLELPRDRLIVFTGVSGSGKSSLAFDTIFAEGQRRYVESLSAYARQFLGQLDKPELDSPIVRCAIAILRPKLLMKCAIGSWNFQTGQNLLSWLRLLGGKKELTASYYLV